jgi:Ras-related protein Rab-32
MMYFIHCINIQMQGQERFSNMTRVYYREAVAAVVVFDITRPGTFEGVARWKQDIDSKVFLPDESRIPCIVLANKCDLTPLNVIKSSEEMNQYCTDNGFIGWMETSVLSNKNVDQGFDLLVQSILEKVNLKPAESNVDALRLIDHHQDQSTTQKKGCCG